MLKIERPRNFKIMMEKVVVHHEKYNISGIRFLISFLINHGIPFCHQKWPININKIRCIVECFISVNSSGDSSDDKLAGWNQKRCKYHWFSCVNWHVYCSLIYLSRMFFAIIITLVIIPITLNAFQHNMNNYVYKYNINYLLN